MVGIVDAPIDPMAVRQAVAWPGAGAVLVFDGVTRDHHDGRGVVHLSYDCYPEMAQQEMVRLRDDVVSRFPGVRVAMVHRVGTVGIGESSVVIAVAAPHRDAAYEASRTMIDELKQRIPIWKKEVYEDGESWKANT